MKADKIRAFMALAGQRQSATYREGNETERKLGARLLLSEVLEYVISGLGVTPVVNGQPIKDPEAVTYTIQNTAPDHIEMLDGLADVAYTMYWNACAFGLNLEDAFELVCDNNLEKFVHLEQWQGPDSGPLAQERWHCDRGISWPDSVVSVEVIRLNGKRYAVGKDSQGKVRKPSSYKQVDLSGLAGVAGAE